MCPVGVRCGWERELSFTGLDLGRCAGGWVVRGWDRMRVYRVGVSWMSDTILWGFFFPYASAMLGIPQARFNYLPTPELTLPMFKRRHLSVVASPTAHTPDGLLLMLHSAILAVPLESSTYPRYNWWLVR